MNSQRSTKKRKNESKADQKTAESAENISAMERNQNIYKMTVSRHFVSGSFGKVARDVHVSHEQHELGTISKYRHASVQLYIIPQMNPTCGTKKIVIRTVQLECH